MSITKPVVGTYKEGVAREVVSRPDRPHVGVGGQSDTATGTTRRLDRQLGSRAPMPYPQSARGTWYILKPSQRWVLQ